MDGRFLDALAIGLGRSRSRRGTMRTVAALAGVAVAGRLRTAEALTFDRDCRNFILSGGRKPTKKLDDVDDDVTFEIRRRNSSRWDVIYEDNDGSVNSDGKPIPTKLLRFRGAVGDELRITLFNRQKGGCSLDAIWLFCDGGRGTGKKILPAFNCNSNQVDQLGRVFQKVVRIEP